MNILACLALSVLLVGCNSIGTFSGAAVGLATGAGTTNPLVGHAAAGIGHLRRLLIRS